VVQRIVDAGGQAVSLHSAMSPADRLWTACSRRLEAPFGPVDILVQAAEG